MTREEILHRGYHSYQPTVFESDGIVACYQKRFDDECGKRYFIHVHEWAPLQLRNGEETGPNFEYEVYLYQRGSHHPIQLLFYAGWELLEVEAHAQALFETDMYDYYERWDET